MNFFVPALLGYLLTTVIMVGFKPKILKTLLYGLLVSYSNRFLNLATLLWAGLTPVQFVDRWMWSFVYCLFFLSSVRVHQSKLGQLKKKFVFHKRLCSVAVTPRSDLSSWIQTLVGHVVFFCLFNLDVLIGQQSAFVCV